MKFLGKNTDILFAFALILMLGLMLIPLPPTLLDFFLALNISFALLILVVSLYIQTPLDFSIFPGLLLVLTLFRLALNINSTRLILIDGYAGKVIETFGQFVIRGNYVVGFIIFVILVVIQFIVIIKGSGRISEVAARFTLDAMPGKQMAIDADLNSGLINENDARLRRERVAREAEFYGAMDGASKFVKGDAIAGLIINGINIIGGFIIGVAQKGMSFTDALQNYTILTIGDGLVTQIPALLISTAAGLVITRSASSNALDRQFKLQLMSNPRVLGTVSGAILLVALMPGMPMIPFFLLGGVLSTSSYMMRKKKISENLENALIKEEKYEQTEDNLEHYLQVDPIEVEIGYGLISLVDESMGGYLFNKIASTRKLIALEYGLLIPAVRVRDNLQLNPNEYIIKVKGNIVANYQIEPDKYLAINSSHSQQPLSGEPTNDPAFHMNAYWISEQEKQRAELLEYTVVDATSVLSTHLQETLKKNFDKIISRQAVKQLLENLKKEYPAVVEDINPDILPIGSIQKVLQNLLKEFIPIKDLVQILESLIDYSKVTKNVDVLTEYVRHAIGDTISNLYKDSNGIIHAVSMDEEMEAIITRSLQNQKDGSGTLGFTPKGMRDLNIQLHNIIEKFKNLGYTAVILTSATIRPYFYRLVSSTYSDLIILSYSELSSNTEIEFIDRLKVQNAD